MSERFTTITLPKTRVGWMCRGECTAEEAIDELRAYMEHHRKELADYDAATLEEFHIYSHNGMHVQRRKKIIQMSTRK